MNISLETLNKYYEDGWLIKQEHPTKDLTIWNYSRQTQWEDHWDEITLMARGLVTNSKGEIACLPFRKFFNWEQLTSVNVKIPDGPFEVYEKMDGQLGLLFWYEDEWIFTSRGSFTSVYAERGWKMLQKYDYKHLPHDSNYIFEIIFKEGRIVCKYDFEDVVLLGSMNRIFGFENFIHDPHWEKFLKGFNIVKKYDSVKDFAELKASIDDNAEGYVIRFKKGLERYSGRMKIKGEEYCRLHSIITKISSRDIWEYLKDDKPLAELLEHVPDEFDAWVKDTADTLTKSYNLIYNRVKFTYQTEILDEEFETRKELALKIKTYDKSLWGIFFNLADGKDISHIIWAKVYPKYSKPFTLNDSEGDDN